MEENDYSDFIIADNDVADGATENVADSQETNTEVETEDTNNDTEDSTEVETEDTETTDEVAPDDVETVEETPKDTKTETQRVSQRINEAKQQAKDEWITSQGYEWNGRPITNETQYNSAIAEQKEQQRRADLESQGIDVKQMDEAIENNPTVKQAKELLAKQASDAAQQKNYNDFVEAFPDVKPESISKDTWESVNKGNSTLVDAYTRQENAELKEKLKVLTQNESSKKKAPISKGVNTHGSKESASEDEFAKGFDSIK